MTSQYYNSGVILLLLLLLRPSVAGAESSENITSPPSAPNPSDFPNPQQYLAYKTIQRFKSSITCDPNNITSTWSGLLPCTYRGFFCETPPGLLNTPTIASVDFNGFHLCAPSLAGFLDSLPDLALFHANSNSFSGGVPDLSSLPFLYELDLSNNRFSGPFPSAVFFIPELIFLDLRFNRFSGAVPSSVFSLAAAGFLFLNNNQFSLQLPADLGDSPVSYLTLANNAFAGPIPRSLGDAGETLREVLFLNNLLSGCLPEEIGLLKSATVFDAGNNRITGQIPESFGCLAEVEQLNLAGNLLYGTVPEVVCRLGRVGRLENLSLSGNYFTWVGSSCWWLIKRGVLDVRRNCIFGLPEQRTAAECGWFFLHQKFCPLQLHIPCLLPFSDHNLTTEAAPSNYRSYYSERHDRPDGN